MHLLFKLISKLDFLFLFCSKDALKLPACCKHGAGQFIDFFFFFRKNAWLWVFGSREHVVNYWKKRVILNLFEFLLSPFPPS